MLMEIQQKWHMQNFYEDHNVKMFLENKTISSPILKFAWG